MVTLPFLMAILVGSGLAQRAYSDDGEDQSLLLNRANPVESVIEKVMPVATKSKKVPLMQRFSSEQEWKQRAEVTLWYDNSDYLVQVDIANQALTLAAEELQKEFDSQCDKGSLY